MFEIDLDSSVPDLVIEYPQLLKLFGELGIESTCGGKSLRTACRDRGLNPSAVVSQCEERLRTTTE